MTRGIKEFNKDNPRHVEAEQKVENRPHYVYTCGCNHPHSKLKAPHFEDTAFYFIVWGVFDNKKKAAKWVKSFVQQWKEDNNGENVPYDMFYVPVGELTKWPYNPTRVGKFVYEEQEKDLQTMIDGFRKQNKAAMEEIEKRRNQEVERGEKLLRESGFKGEIPKMPTNEIKNTRLTGKERRALKRKKNQPKESE